MLFFMHRYISEPVLRLCRSVYKTLAEQEENAPDSVNASIAVLDRLVHETAREKQRLTNLLTSIHNVNATLPDQKNDPEFWETLCQALQTNPDYLLVWVGLPAGNDEYPSPVTGCGCVSSSPAQCRQTINHLITYCRQEGSLCDTARKAAAGKEIVVDLIPVSSMPDTLRSSLPFNKKKLLCASFPVVNDQNLTAVVTIYSTLTHCFARIEKNILRFFFQQIVNIPDQAQYTTGELTGAGVYKYSVIGALSAGIAHEMINTSNGVLNYSQALLDLMADKTALEEERFLLQKLHKEELKNAGLTGELVKLTARSNTKPEKIDFTSLFGRAVQLLRGHLKENGIQIVIDAKDQLPAVTVAEQPLLIILLTMLHRAADHVIRKTDDGRKVITAVILAENNNNSLSLSIDNYPVAVDNVEQKVTDGAWPDMSTCTEMAQAIGGSFTTGTRKKGTTTCCTLTLPVA
jgi:hypothetical protein